MANITIHNLLKKYPNGYEAIKKANVQIKDKEFVVLVGPSGCGKSTLLRMIAGLEEISDGDLLFEEEKMNDIHPKDRDIAMVFQNYALYPHMTVYENMAFGLKLKKVPKAEIDKKVQHAAEILGIQEMLDRRPKEMSGGQRQRVAIGRAIVRNPKVFLFDEPLSNLDAKLRVQMRTEIKKLHQRLQATMVYVTHDQIEAMTMGDKIVVLKDGEVQQVDTPMNLFNKPANQFVASFIGSPSMNFLEGKIVKEDHKISFKSKEVVFGVPIPFEPKLENFIGKSVTFGFRPEYIYDKEYEKNTRLSEDMHITIETVEPIGSETFIYFRFKGNRDQMYCFRTNSTHTYKTGDEVVIGVDINRLRFFDDETGQRIKLQEELKNE